MGRFRGLVVILVVASAAALPAQDGADIARDPDLFSPAFRQEFEEMDRLFREFGFELDVFDGMRPTLPAVIATYGEPERTEDLEVTLAADDGERQVTLTFHYYDDVGFGVRPDDAEQVILRVKRRED